MQSSIGSHFAVQAAAKGGSAAVLLLCWSQYPQVGSGCVERGDDQGLGCWFGYIGAAFAKILPFHAQHVLSGLLGFVPAK